MEDEGKKVMGAATMIASKLEGAGVALETPALGPALIVLGMTVAARAGEQAMAMRAVVASGTTMGVLKTPSEAVAKLRENPQVLAAFLKHLMGRDVGVEVEAAPAARRFPWKR